MTQPNLKLFRRHEASCTQEYGKEFRVYQWMLEKQKGKKATADCSCTIYAEGTLVKNSARNYIRPKSTDKRVWSEAETVKANWLKWGDTRPPADAVPDGAEAGTLVTIQAAVNAFRSMKENQIASGAIKKDRFNDVERFLDGRLVPFATITHRYRYINEMDNDTVWANFAKSWKNRRKDTLNEPLEPGTIATTTANLREFLKFCVRKEWLSDNYASKEYGMTATAEVKPKEPFSETELSYIYRAARELKTGVGVNTSDLVERVKELQAFVWTLRYTGLRISDVSVLKAEQLRDFRFKNYTHAIWCNPKKTRGKKAVNFVHIPIPSTNLKRHPNVVKALQAIESKQGRYFFKAGEGKDSTSRSAWQRKINALFERAEELMEADGFPMTNGTHFAEHPTPHKFRHTFAATLLQGGMSIRLVAQYLGDNEETVRKHYSKVCKEEQEQAASQMTDAYEEYDAQIAETQKAKLRVVK
jgi:integrase